MGKGSTHQHGEYQIRTLKTPRQGWQAWAIKDGCEKHSVKGFQSEAAAFDACSHWINQQSNRSAA